MGCKGSKTKDEDSHPYSDKLPLTDEHGAAQNDIDKVNLSEPDEFAHVPFIDATVVVLHNQSEIDEPLSSSSPRPPIVDNSIKVKKLNDDECVVQTSYQTKHFFNNEQTLDKLKQEAFDVVKKRCCQSDEWEVLRHIQSLSCSCCTTFHEKLQDECKCFDRSLMLKLINIIRSRSEEDENGNSLSNLDQLCEHVGSASNVDDLFDQKLQKCIGFLLDYAQSNSDRGSFLRAIGSRLSGAVNDEIEVEKGDEERSKKGSGMAEFLKQTSGNAGLMVDSRENENVEVIVKKTVSRKYIEAGKDSLRELLQNHGLEYSEEMLNAKEILIETDPPAELDVELKNRAKLLMQVADSVNGTVTATELDNDDDDDDARSPKLQKKTPTTSAETVLSEVVNELTEAIIKDL